MTPDQLRTGAAIVRRLVEGDETARGPLSDFLEEFGVSPIKHTHTDVFSRWACNLLRSPRTLEYEWWWWTPKQEMLTVRARCVREPGIYTVILAWLPAWAWEGREPTSEAS